MSALPYEQLISTSLHLPSEQRGELATLLLQSLENELPTGQSRSADQWQQELAARSDALQSGAASIASDDSIAGAKSRLKELKKP